MSTNPFEKLVEQSKTLTDSNASQDIPQLNRDLNEISNELNALNLKLGSSQGGLNASAHYFLAQSGANTQEIGASLKNINTQFAFAPDHVNTDTDVESYLQHTQDNYMKATVEQTRSKTRERFLNSMDEIRYSNWDNSKKSILQDWDLQQDNKMFGRKKTVVENRIDPVKNQIQSYADTVKELNASRLIHCKIPIISKFKALSSSIECTKSQRESMNEAWDIASHFASNTNSTRGAYLQQNYDNADIVRLNNRLIQASKTWLEKQYFSLAKELLLSNATVAKIGGSPSIIRSLHAFMEIKYKNANRSSWIYPHLEIHEKTPIWLFLYILLRSGHPKLALKFVEDQHQAFSLHEGFSSYLREYLSSPDFRLTETSRKIIFNKYAAMAHGVQPTDPFKLLLYKILGRCELHLKSLHGVITTIEDYTWLQLTLVRETVQEERSDLETYRLRDFQKIISDQQPEHFSENKLNPWFYFNVLLLSLQLEKAVTFLYSNKQFRMEAVHFGIALVYHGLIRIPKHPRSNTFDLLITESDQSVRLNFSCLIDQFCRLFTHDNSANALQYLLLLTLYPTEDMYILCREKICNLVVQSPNYKSLIGQYSTLEETRQGLLEKYKYLVVVNSYNDKEYVQKVLLPIAEIFKDYGKLEDAASVQHLIQAYPTA